MNTLDRACRFTGEGSNLLDVLLAAKRLNVVARTVTADDQGLMALPKPLIATAEHDHFIAVVGADKHGVTYVCSDCGPWPGGEVHLNWQQWHLLESTLYVTVSRPGSAADKLLATLSGHPQLPRVSYAGELSKLHIGGRFNLAGASARLRGHVILAHMAGNTGCGTKPTAPPCPPPVLCSCVGGGPPPTKANAHSASSGPTGGDPVNPVTLEEDYRPASDLTVYNPVGPSINWARQYRSLRGPAQGPSVIYDPNYEAADFGVGWSQNYNVGVTNPQKLVSHNGYPVYSIGTTNTVMPFTTAQQYNQTQDSWTVFDGSFNQVASSSSPNGWSMTNSGSNYTLTIPASATIGLSYMWHFTSAATQLQGIGAFNVQAVAPSSGNKQIFFPNGSQVAFNAPAVPNSTAVSAPTTTASSRVACSVDAGAPYLVEWDYDANNVWGHFVVTMADRTKWITTTASPSSPMCFRRSSIATATPSPLTTNQRRPCPFMVLMGCSPKLWMASPS